MAPGVRKLLIQGEGHQPKDQHDRWGFIKRRSVSIADSEQLQQEYDGHLPRAAGTETEQIESSLEELSHLDLGRKCGPRTF